MWFRSSSKPTERAVRWADFARTLELRDATSGAERLRRFLDLEDAEVLHLHVLQRDSQPSLYLFDVRNTRSGPAGVVHRWASWAVVRADRTLSEVAFRASPRREAVLESLEASRTGAMRVDLSDRPDVDARMAVLARDPTKVLGALAAPATEVLLRLVGQGPSASVVVGERHLIARVDVDPEADPGLALTPLATDLLALSALLPRPPLLSIDESDFLQLDD